jgi:hypothetical protein
MEFWCLIDLQERFGASVAVDGAARNHPANRQIGQKLDFPFIITHARFSSEEFRKKMTNVISHAENEKCFSKRHLNIIDLSSIFNP